MDFYELVALYDPDLSMEIDRFPARAKNESPTSANARECRPPLPTLCARGGFFGGEK